VDEKLKLLKGVPLFSRLGGHALEEVGRLAEEIDLPAGRELMRQGSPGSEFFVIVTGTVRIDQDGSTIRTLGPGDFLGEIALIDGGPRTATATAESAVRVLVLGRREFNTLIADFPEIRLAVLEALAHRVRRHEPDAT
jgi:CRP/FNR family transcriptional regulator, cyclic AMP receptor protein